MEDFDLHIASLISKFLSTLLYRPVIVQSLISHQYFRKIIIDINKQYIYLNVVGYAADTMFQNEISIPVKLAVVSDYLL